ncbi:MAG: tRNA epoxyqueuosine(34) reductase QueG [Planctomycetia bacterium]|nr:tRNA epoxyqueuosine(34) reductase QueG [Planctomycetia bacterium]
MESPNDLNAANRAGIGHVGRLLNSRLLVEELRRESVRVGFSRLGIAPAGPPPRRELVRQWLDQGFAGVMREWFEHQEPLRADPENLLPGVRSVIMLATDHATSTDGTADVGGAGEGSGRVARYAWGADYHDLLRSRVNMLGAWLEARVPGCRTRGVVDSAPLAERDFAWLAGLGWFGKNTMLIDPRAGSFFFLTALLTDLELPPDTPVEVDHCGTCTACLDACPTGAFVEPRVLDASRCISALSIEDHGPIAADLRPGMQDWIFGCDICQEVCPWNRHAPGSTEPTFQPSDGLPTPSLAAILGLDTEAFRKRFKGTPLRRAKRRGLLRSAAIALGNRPHAPSFDALAAALADEEPVVRGAAAWALGRWRHADVVAERARVALIGRIEIETDADVRAEIERALA